MDNRSRYTYGALAVFLPGAFFFAPRARTHEAPAQQGSASIVADTRRVASAPKPKTATDLVTEYLGTSLNSIPADQRPIIRTLIVDLPDPVDARNLDWGFDAGVIAVRRAAESMGTVLDRFWLPWSARGAETKTVGSAAQPALTSPGVLLFRPVARPAKGRETLRVVFIVGETPNGGANKEQFRGAMAQIALLHKRSKPSEDTLRVVGPYFTGSARSLRLALSTRKRPASFRLVQMTTGSATQEGIRGELANIPGVPVEFDAAINSDVDLLRVVDTVVQGRLKFKPDEVALLQETSTAYGQLAPGTGTTSPADRYTVLPFPMHIASLRDQQEAGSRDASPSLGRSQTPFTISLRDPGTAADRPPSISGLTPPAISLAIEQITSTLRERHFRAVGIIATDIRDKLFLAREVRRQLPDVQLFTTESNVLYLWPEYNDVLRGMLVATSYPLEVETQDWHRQALEQRKQFKRGDERLVVFTEEAGQGIYNAVLLHFGAGDRLIDFGVPGVSGGRRYLPIWVVGVGRRTFVPLHVDTAACSATQFVAIVDSASRSTNARASCGFPSQDTTRAGAAAGLSGRSSIIFVIIAGFVLLVARMVELSRTWKEYRCISRPTDADAVSFATLRRHIFSRSLLLHQQLYTMFRDLAFAAGIVVLAVVLLHAHQADSGGESLASLPRILGVIGGLVVLFSLGWATKVFWVMTGYGTEFALRRNWHTERRWRDTSNAATTLGHARFRQAAWLIEIAIRFGVIVVAVLFALIVLSFMLAAEQPLEPRFGGLAVKLFFERAAHLNSGLSPILPLLIIVLGFAAWATWHLSRIELLKNPVPFEAFAEVTRGSNEDLAARLAKCVRQIRERLFLVIPDGLGLAIFVVILLLAAATYSRFNRTLESIALPAVPFLNHNAFDLLLIGGVLASLGSIAWGVYRFWTVWLSLKRLLEDLSASPLLPAFERIPQRVSHLSQLTLRPSSTREAMKGVSATQWSHLRAIEAGAREVLSQLPADVTAAVERFSISAGEARVDAPFDTGEDARALAMHSASTAPHAIDADKERAEQAAGQRLGLLFGGVQAFWRHEPEKAQLDSAISFIKEPPFDENTSGSLRRLVDNSARLWLRTAEETLAVQIVAYIEWVLQHLRALALFLLVGVLLATALLSSYPFQPQASIKMIFIGLLVGTVASILTVGTQMNRDEVISRVTRSDPGRITWSAGYVLNLILFGVLPILTYVGSGVQPIREGLLGWLEPLARALTPH